VAKHEQPERAALITGANGGIGRALCEAFASAGYHVIATDQSDANCEHHAFIKFNLAAFASKPSAQLKFFNEVEAALGARQLNVCINNAAVQILGSLAELTQDEFTETLNVNLIAPLLLAKGLLPLLRKSAGSVINIGSIHANLTKPRFISYATSKSALAGLTRAMAVDLGGVVRVNCIQPAAIRTDMLDAGFKNNPSGLAQLNSYHPAGKIGEPSEIASLAVLLASCSLPFLSGAVIDINGAIGARLHDPD